MNYLHLRDVYVKFMNLTMAAFYADLDPYAD